MIRKPFVPLVGSMRWGTIIRIGYYGALAALILLNGIVFLPRLGRAPSQRPSEVAYDLPRIGAALPATSIPTTDGDSITVPTTNKKASLLYISEEVPSSIPDLVFLAVLAETDLTERIDIAWLRIPRNDVPEISVPAPSFPVIEANKQVLKKLGLVNPRPHTVLVANPTRILYEGPLLHSRIIPLIINAADLSQSTFLQRPMIGDRVSGYLVSKSGQELIDLTQTNRIVSLLLYPGSCPSCGLDPLKLLLSQVASLTVVEVFPSLSNSRDLQRVFLSSDLENRFWLLNPLESSINTASFLAGVPTLILVENGQVLYVNSSPMQTRDLVGEVIHAIEDRH